MDTPLTNNHNPRQFTVISSLHHQWELRQDLDDCRVTVRVDLRDFSGHLFVRNSQVSLLVVFSWPHVEPESVIVRSLIMQMHAGFQMAQWMRKCTKMEEKVLPSNLLATVHRSAWSWEWFSVVTQLGYQSIFWWLITQWSTCRFHIIQAQGGEYLWRSILWIHSVKWVIELWCSCVAGRSGMQMQVCGPDHLQF